MTVPGRVEAASLLLSLDPEPWLLRHARAVAEIAGWLAARTAWHGARVDRRSVEAAALLHDVDKALAPHDPLRRMGHGHGSAAWLAQAGHPELGPMVTGHPVTRLRDGEAFDRWLGTASLEGRIVAYADKRAGQRLESMDARFASWRRRYPVSSDRRSAGEWSESTLADIRARATRLETDVCRTAGIAPDEVRRLAWTDRAIRSARSRSTREP